MYFGEIVTLFLWERLLFGQKSSKIYLYEIFYGSLNLGSGFGFVFFRKAEKGMVVNVKKIYR